MKPSYTEDHVRQAIAFGLSKKGPYAKFSAEENFERFTNGTMSERTKTVVEWWAQLIADTQRATLAQIEQYAQSEIDFVNRRSKEAQRRLHSVPFLNAMNMIVAKCRSLLTPNTETIA